MQQRDDGVGTRHGRVQLGDVHRPVVRREPHVAGASEQLERGLGDAAGDDDAGGHLPAQTATAPSSSPIAASASAMFSSELA